ncbi:UNVERIFIED_CONTAM: hypothetical protein Sradi_6472100 [Sesamum radiatum]|uniref:URB1 N-terminal domain-containing protein n=1 Tax=Sesamum radiatum TaxID=300843 RepID=A0AAW2K6B8_SESRA
MDDKLVTRRLTDALRSLLKIATIFLILKPLVHVGLRWSAVGYDEHFILKKIKRKISWDLDCHRLFFLPVDVFLAGNRNVVGDGGGVVGQALDTFARALIEEKMGDLYKELNSKEAKRQNAVLLLLASIVRRNSQLAWELAKVFDFKLTGFPKLAELSLRRKKFVEKSYSTRKAFVGFAMSFLEVGSPRCLRGGFAADVFRGVEGLGMMMMRLWLLVPESLVPPGLRSVLFRSVTLEQLVSISGKDDFGGAAELAHNVLLLVCTDPVNGLMPDLERHPSPLRGNPKRLLGLMKKLKATEVAYHKSLVMSIVRGRPSLGSAYLDEFPYSIEDLASDNW